MKHVLERSACKSLGGKRERNYNLEDGRLVLE